MTRSWQNLSSVVIVLAAIYLIGCAPSSQRKSSPSQSTLPKQAAQTKQTTQAKPPSKPQVPKAARQKYWAYNIGRVSTEILFQKASDKPPTQQQLDALKKGYREVGMPVNFFNKIPMGNDADYETLKSVILDEAQLQLEDSVGIEASETFGLAKDFKIVEVILEQVKTNEKVAFLVPKQVEKIRISAQAAGFSETFIQFLDKFETISKDLPKDSALNTCTIMWKQMADRLNDIDTAAPLVHELK